MFKTAIFKLHNPSKRKQVLLQKAFKNYHLLYDRLLKAISYDVDGFYNAIAYTSKSGEVKYDDKKAEGYIRQRYKNILNAFVLSSGLKESLCKDLAGNLISYRELLTQRQNISYPSLQKLKAHKKHEVLLSLYEAFKTCIDDDTYKYLRDELGRQSREQKTVKPLQFIRCDASHQNMTFLYNPTKKKYYTLLHILPSSNKQKLIISPEQKLHDIRTCQLFTKPKGTSTAILFSIETGQRIVDRYLNAKAEPKEGKLVYDNEKNEYYLHVSFEFKPEKIVTETIMGIDRGIEAICAYAVLDNAYKVVKEGLYEGKTLKELLKNEEKRIAKLQSQGKVYRLKVRKNFANRIIHEATNLIADTALKYKSQVYVEDLKAITERSKSRNRSTFNKILNRSQFQKFLFTLNYKLEEKGLPQAKSVHPAFTSMTCFKCGHIAKENRPKFDSLGNSIQEVFRCVKCGHEDNADMNASKIIALKGVWTYISKKDKIKQKVETFSDFVSTRVFAL